VDAKRFDHMTKALTRGRDRRTVLSRTGGVLASVLVLLGAPGLLRPAVRDVAAQTTCLVFGSRCGREFDPPCCSGRCVRKRGTNKKFCRRPKDCPETRCKNHMVCGVKSVHCDVGPGTGCSCVLSVEGCRACIDENVCGPGCTSSAECVALEGYGPGAVCQHPDSGCCGRTCLKPCPE
jgi:hypothetical protein